MHIACSNHYHESDMNCFCIRLWHRPLWCAYILCSASQHSSLCSHYNVMYTKHPWLKHPHFVCKDMPSIYRYITYYFIEMTRPDCLQPAVWYEVQNAKPDDFLFMEATSCHLHETANMAYHQTQDCTRVHQIWNAVVYRDHNALQLMTIKVDVIIAVLQITEYADLCTSS